MRKQRYIFHEKAILEQELKALNQLTEGICLEEEGKLEEGKIRREEALRLLDEMIEKLKNKTAPQMEREADRSIFPQSGEYLAEGERTILRVLHEEEKEQHLAALLAHSPVKGTPNQKRTEKALWQDACAENTFVCSIYDKNYGDYLGYCSIKDLIRHDWELAIELMPEACHKGYGTEALRIFMDAVHKLTGERSFRARVEIDNYASQGLMKKLGARADGISEFAIHGEDLERFRAENKDLIMDEMRAAAAEFCMEAEDILGYVLEYRLEVGD